MKKIHYFSVSFDSSRNLGTSHLHYAKVNSKEFKFSDYDSALNCFENCIATFNYSIRDINEDKKFHSDVFYDIIFEERKPLMSSLIDPCPNQLYSYSIVYKSNFGLTPDILTIRLDYKHLTLDNYISDDDSALRCFDDNYVFNDKV